MLVFGIIDFGRMASARIGLTAAARAAQNVFQAGTLTLVSTSGTCPANPTPTATVSVTIQYNFTFATPVAVFAGMLGGNHPMQATGVVPCRA
jgi:hypothetical protein